MWLTSAGRALLLLAWRRGSGQGLGAVRICTQVQVANKFGYDEHRREAQRLRGGCQRRCCMIPRAPHAIAREKRGMPAASEFEFKHRFWIIGAIFTLGFLSYNLDPQNAGAAVTDCFARIHGATATRNDYRLTFVIASLFTVAAALIRTWGTAYLNPEVMIAMRVQTARLVADGPYRYVRNPLYFGNILWAVGFGFMASRIGFFILVPGMTTFVYRLILREEAGILASQGESYRAYCAAVPRLLPTLRPKLPAGEGAPHWADGLLGEAFVWIMAASEVAFALTLKETIFFVLLGLSFLVHGVFVYVIKLRQKSRAAELNAEQHAARHES